MPLENETPVARREILAGFIIIVAFIGIVVVWIGLVPLSSAAIAPGIVGVEGNRKTVQHLEGGIIREILVQDGDVVTADQSLIILDAVQIRSYFDLLQKQRDAAGALEARLVAEYDNEDDIHFPDWLLARASEQHVRAAIDGQRKTFQAKRKLLQEQIAIARHRVGRARARLAGLEARSRELEKQAALGRKELAAYQKLANDGFAPRTQIFKIKNRLLELEESRGTTRAAIASARQEIEQLAVEQSELGSSYTQQAIRNLNKIRDEIVALDQDITKTRDRLERTVIRAPIDGVIVNMTVHTAGGVIAPGQSLLDIVPSDSSLTIEARVDPKDRDSIRIGQTAEIRFTAFNQRVTAPINGRVVLISADRLVDPMSGSPYYQARILMLEDPGDVLDGATIFPGMQAEVLILTGSRTTLAYLVTPLVQSFNRAFRED